MANKHYETCSCAEKCAECKCNPSTKDDSKPYFGSYPFDLEERISDFIDSQPRIRSSKQEV